MELLVNGFLGGWDAVSASGIWGRCEDDGCVGAGCGDIGEEFHHCRGVGLGVELAVIGFVGSEGEDEDIGFEVGDLLYGLWGFVDEVGELRTYNTTMVIHNASLFLGNDFETVEGIVVLGGRIRDQTEGEIVGGLLGLVTAHAPAGRVKLAACPHEFWVELCGEGFVIGGVPDVDALHLWHTEVAKGIVFGKFFGE